MIDCHWLGFSFTALWSIKHTIFHILMAYNIHKYMKKDVTMKVETGAGCVYATQNHGKQVVVHALRP